MATITTSAPVRVGTLSFYSWMGVAFVLTAFLGFAPTYWAPLAAGKFAANPVVHIHGMIFFTWTLFFFLQTLLIPGGQVRTHRALGLAGISLATVMCVLGVLVALNSLNTAVALGAADAGEAFLIVPLLGIATFAVLVGFAIVNIKRPETHKRLMLLATASILAAPIARPLFVWVFALPPGPPPVWAALVASMVSWLFFLAGAMHDWRTRGRPHLVYLTAAPAVMITEVLSLPISNLAVWRHTAHAFLALAGTTPIHPG